MSATFAPFGMRPSYHPTGLDRATAYPNGIYYDPESVVDNVAPGPVYNIFKGQPVKVTAGGWIIPKDTFEQFVGCFAGCEWTDATGRRRISNYWPANNSFIVGSVVVYAYDDSKIVYEMQMDGAIPPFNSGGALISQFDIVNETAGFTGTGLSSCALDSDDVAGGDAGDMQVIGISYAVDNSESDPYPIVRAQISHARYQYNRDTAPL